MQDLPVPSWMPRAILPIGFLLLAFRLSQVLYLLLTGQRAQLLGDEAEDALKLREDEPVNEVKP
jgi:C4-dicarboxylate transporter DctQ subunit